MPSTQNCPTNILAAKKIARKITYYLSLGGSSSPMPTRSFAPVAVLFLLVFYNLGATAPKVLKNNQGY